MGPPYDEVLARYRLCKSTLVGSILQLRLYTNRDGAEGFHLLLRPGAVASILQGAQEEPSPRQHQGVPLNHLSNLQLRRRAE